jgi:CheY-like chemotaxis protein
MTKQKTILVVDDEKDIRKTVEEILGKEGYKIVTAVNGDDCLEKLKKIKPNLILMDIMMPGTPVSVVVKKIKDIKISYLSVVKVSEAEREDLTEQKNIIGFIQKPFSVDDLISNVKKMIGN